MKAHICMLAVLATTSVSGQQASPVDPPPAVASGTFRVLPPVKLYDGVAPGSENWTIPEFWWMEANGLTRKPGDPDRPSRGRGGR